MGITWGRWRTRTVVAGLFGGGAYVLVLLAGDLWAAEIASHDPPCSPSASFSCAMPPSFFDVVGLQVASVLLGVVAIVAVLEFADRRVVRAPRGLERVLIALAFSMLPLPSLAIVGLASPRAMATALVLAGPPVVLTVAYLVGPPPVAAAFSVRHPYLARARTPPLGTRVVRAGRSLAHLFVPYPNDAPPQTMSPTELRRDRFSTTPDADRDERPIR